ncbi:MAG: hypothetical protein ACI4T5_10425 [Prevotella sp.]
MEKCKELFTHAIENSEGDEVWHVVHKFLEEVAQSEPKLYEEFMCHMEKMAYRIPREEAERIVRNMRPKGQYWSYQQVKDFGKDHGVTDDWVNWYLVMNMVYNDYCDTAKTYGLQDDVEFFFSLARDFIEDPDAKPLKVEKYFLD